MPHCDCREFAFKWKLSSFQNHKLPSYGFRSSLRKVVSPKGRFSEGPFLRRVISFGVMTLRRNDPSEKRPFGEMSWPPLLPISQRCDDQSSCVAEIFVSVIEFCVHSTYQHIAIDPVVSVDENESIKVKSAEFTDNFYSSVIMEVSRVEVLLILLSIRTVQVFISETFDIPVSETLNFHHLPKFVKFLPMALLHQKIFVGFNQSKISQGLYNTLQVFSRFFSKFSRPFPGFQEVFQVFPGCINPGYFFSDSPYFHHLLSAKVTRKTPFKLITPSYLIIIIMTS